MARKLPPSSKLRGRTHINDVFKPSPTSPNVPVSARAETTRSVTAGGGSHRGDRRDTSRAYTNNTRHPSRGGNPRPDVKTRKK